LPTVAKADAFVPSDNAAMARGTKASLGDGFVPHRIARPSRGTKSSVASG